MKFMGYAHLTNQIKPNQNSRQATLLSPLQSGVAWIALPYCEIWKWQLYFIASIASIVSIARKSNCCFWRSVRASFSVLSSICWLGNTLADVPHSNNYQTLTKCTRIRNRFQECMFAKKLTGVEVKSYIIKGRGQIERKHCLTWLAWLTCSPECSLFLISFGTTSKWLFSPCEIKVSSNSPVLNWHFFDASPGFRHGIVEVLCMFEKLCGWTVEMYMIMYDWSILK